MQDTKNKRSTPTPAPRETFAGYCARTGAMALLAAVSLYYTAAWLWVTPRRVMSDYALTLTESQPTAGALRVARGEALYTDYRTVRPVLPLPYGVLTYWIPGMMTRATGAGGAAEALTALRLGRLVAALSTLGIAAVLLFLARQRGIPWRWAWLAAVPLVWFPRMMEWTGKFFPDTPALFFSLAGWALLGPPGATSPNAGGRANPGLGKTLAAAALWTLGFHFKPTLLAGPIGFGIERLFHAAAAAREAGKAAPRLHWNEFAKEARPVMPAAAAFLTLAGITSAALHFGTDGLWTLHVVGANRVWEHKTSFILMNFYQLRLGSLAALAGMLALAATTLRRAPLFAAFFLCFLLDTLAMSKQGSNVNYLLGSVALWGLATVVAASPNASSSFAAEGSRSLLRGLSTRWIAGLVAAALLLHAPLARIVRWESAAPRPGEIEQVDQWILRFSPDEIVCAEGLYGLQRGLPILFGDSYHAAALETRGLVDFTPEIEAAREFRYAMIITNRLFLGNDRYHDLPTFPPALGHELRRAYKPVFVGNWLMVWTPERPALQNSAPDNRPQ